MIDFKADKCKILRGTNKDFPNTVVAVDQEGNTVLVVDNSWTDEHLMQLLKVAHRATQMGIIQGRKEKAEEIINVIKHSP